MAALPIPKIASGRLIKGADVHKALASYINSYYGKLLLITGAGCSSDSGIPVDSGTTNILTRFQDYKLVGNSSYNALETQRQRWWSRAIYSYYLNYLPAKPNKIHHLIKDLSHRDAFHGHITLNVDGLFQKAGLKSDRFVELSGNFLDDAICSSCTASINGMDHLSHTLALNPIHAEHIAELKATADLTKQVSRRATMLPPHTPNGDMVVTNRMPVKFFNLVPCPKCSRKNMMPGQLLSGRILPKAMLTKLNHICGAAPPGSVPKPLTEGQLRLPEEEQKELLLKTKMSLQLLLSPPKQFLF
ncbi:hypothetical protein DSO57_1008736 [Entomophthora muscae]|uniref:Uncharacterized protein n=1 Tax=Entomophthora muscae TaxID=34485 RepID=A0ACC2THQ6_9FUNG|nr:hypothetical protein DSO57_1008736 [Entomophthora muscae]